MTDEHTSHHEDPHHEHHEHEHHEQHAHHEAAHGSSHGIPNVDFKKVSGAALKGGFSDVIEILKLNRSRINAVAGRESEGFGIAMIYLFIGSLGAPLGTAIIGYSILGTRITMPFFDAVFGAVVTAFAVMLTLYVTNLVAQRLFKGKGAFPQFFRVMGYAYLLNIVAFLTFVPFLGVLVSLYLLVVTFITLKEIHKMDDTNAVLTILVTFGAALVISYLLGAFGLSTGIMGAGYGSAGMTSGSHVIISY
jgi:hypothetical protein